MVLLQFSCTALSLFFKAKMGLRQAKLYLFKAEAKADVKVEVNLNLNLDLNLRLQDK